MPDHLTTEQIELLRGLPSVGEEPVQLDYSGDVRRLIAWRYIIVEGADIWRSAYADLLLATIDAERERVLEAIVGDLENAATDCDGHTPYSILMALAEEIRAEHSANPQGETDQ